MSMTDWGDVIRRQGEESREAEQKKLAELKEQLPAEIEKLKDLEHEELLAHYVHHNSSGYMTVFKEIHEAMAAAAKEEILVRMKFIR